MATAAISAGASLLGGIASGKGAAKAAKIQAASYQAGINEQKNEFNTVQTNNAPYMAAGTTGLNAYLNLLGLGSGGASGQQTAIDALQASPTYTSEFNSGLDALTQQEAATGGVRGGNNVLASSTFGSNLLSSLIQQSLGNYGNLISTGQEAASGTNSAALSTGNNISSLLGQQGTANATVAAAPYATFASVLNGLGSAAGNYASSSGSSGVWNGSGAFPSSAYGW